MTEESVVLGAVATVVVAPDACAVVRVVVVEAPGTAPPAAAADKVSVVDGPGTEPPETAPPAGAVPGAPLGADTPTTIGESLSAAAWPPVSWDTTQKARAMAASSRTAGSSTDVRRVFMSSSIPSLTKRAIRTS